MSQSLKRKRDELEEITADFVTLENKMKKFKEQLDEEPKSVLFDTEGKRFYLKQFDINQINVKQEGQRVGIFGMAGSGKSTMVKQIMFANRQIPCSIIQTECLSYVYKPLLGKNIVVSERFDENKLKKVQTRQKRFWTEHNSHTNQFIVNPAVLVVFDGLAQYTKEMEKSPALNYFFSHRHNALAISVKQYYTDMKAAHRRALSWIILFRQTSPKDIKAVWIEYFSSMVTLKEFTEILNRATEGHGCLVFDILSNSERIEDRLFVWSGPFFQETFTMGTHYGRKLQRFYDKNNWNIQGEELLAKEAAIVEKMKNEQ